MVVDIDAGPTHTRRRLGAGPVRRDLGRGPRYERGSRTRDRQVVDDRVDAGVFRVDRSVYTDEGIFEAEMKHIFEAGWMFLCHESQVEKPGDYYATEIGRQPVFVMRQKDGSLACFINACSHRGALLTPVKQGNARALTCRFHGWVYDLGGRWRGYCSSLIGAGGLLVTRLQGDQASQGYWQCILLHRFIPLAD